MRWMLVLVAILVVGVSLAAFAQGEDDPDKDVKQLKEQVALLELEVEYLVQRERALTEYIVLNLERGKLLGQGFAASRREGFTKAAISSTSREILLNTLERGARDLQEGVPVLTDDQARLLKQIERLRKAR